MNVFNFSLPLSAKITDPLTGNATKLPSVEAFYGPYKTLASAISEINNASTGYKAVMGVNPPLGLKFGVQESGKLFKEYLFVGDSTGSAIFTQDNCIQVGSGTSSTTTTSSLKYDSIEVTEIQKGSNINLGIDASGKLTISAGTLDEETSNVIYLDNFASIESYKDSLHEGDVIYTKGYYSSGDGGGARYIVKKINEFSSSSYYSPGTLVEYNNELYYQNAVRSVNGEFSTTNWRKVYDDEGRAARSIVSLGAHLYADINIIDAELNVLLLGAKGYRYLSTLPTISWSSDGQTISKIGSSVVVDSRLAFEAYVYLCNRRSKQYELIIPPGSYFCSPTYLVGKYGVKIRGQVKLGGNCNTSSIIHALTWAQDYIWTVAGNKKINHKDYTSKNSSGTYNYTNCDSIKIENIEFNGQVLSSGDYSNYSISPKVALVCCNTTNSYFDGLHFLCLKGGAMLITGTQETYFGLINLRGCGGFANGVIIPPIWFAAGAASYASSTIAKVFDIAETDYVLTYNNGRNCSAIYFNYLNIEGTVGSPFTAERGADFTHSEINNVLWEGTNSASTHAKWTAVTGNFTRSSDMNYTTACAVTADSGLDDPIFIRTGLISGDCYDVSIHCVTETWGHEQGGCFYYVYNNRKYVIMKTAIAVIGANTDEHCSIRNSGSYTNIHLGDYNLRKKMYVLYMQGGSAANSSLYGYGAKVFSCNRSFSFNPDYAYIKLVPISTTTCGGCSIPLINVMPYHNSGKPTYYAAYMNPYFGGVTDENAPAPCKLVASRCNVTFYPNVNKTYSLVLNTTTASGNNFTVKTIKKSDNSFVKNLSFASKGADAYNKYTVKFSDYGYTDEDGVIITLGTLKLASIILED